MFVSFVWLVVTVFLQYKTVWTDVIWLVLQLSALHLPYHLQPAGTVLSQFSRMSARAQIVASARVPSYLAVMRGRCPGRHWVVSSFSGSLPSWFVGNPVAVTSFRFLITYVTEQTLCHFADAVAPDVAVPSWAYVSHRIWVAHTRFFPALKRYY
jgi:hypothetical protein